MVSKALGYGQRKLIDSIVRQTWNVENPSEKKFNIKEVLYIIQEMQADEGKAYLEQDYQKGTKLQVFHQFVKHLLYRNLANYDSMVLLSSEKGTGKSSAAIMMAREWCRLIGIQFNPERHMAYSNQDVMDKIDTLKHFEPLICLTGDSLIRIKKDGLEYEERIDNLVNMDDYQVLSYNIVNNNYEYKTPSKTIEQPEKKKCYSIYLENGKKIKATAEHLILTKNGYKKIEDLTEDDEIKVIDYKCDHCKKIFSPKVMSFSKIKKIKKPVKKTKVYDIIDIPENHNFIANDMVVHNCDEAVRFASSADWNKKESKALKKKLAEVRTKHLFFILCFPLKIQKVEKTYLEAFVNYWCDLFGRGLGAIYVKDKNPVNDPWRQKDFQKIGSYTEFTSLSDVEKKLKKHPNFWKLIRFPKPPKHVYSRYVKVRESNVYNNETVRQTVTSEDVQKALLVLALQDVMQNDSALTINRIALYIKNTYDIPISSNHIKNAISDAKQLVNKIREENAKDVTTS